MVGNGQYAIWLLRFTSLLLSLLVVGRIFSMLPEDDELAEGFAIVGMFFAWLAVYFILGGIGFLAAKYARYDMNLLSAGLWSVTSLATFLLSVSDLEYGNFENAAFFAIGLVICSIPFVAGWSWSKKPAANMKALQ